jgi:hypothetical protein
MNDVSKVYGRHLMLPLLVQIAIEDSLELVRQKVEDSLVLDYGESIDLVWMQFQLYDLLIASHGDVLCKGLYRG